MQSIRWVITVPAIWSHASKRFMREAAHKVRYQYMYNILYLPSHGGNDVIMLPLALLVKSLKVGGLWLTDWQLFVTPTWHQIVITVVP